MEMNKKFKLTISLSLALFISTSFSSGALACTNNQHALSDNNITCNDMLCTNPNYSEINLKLPKDSSEPIKITDSLNNKNILKINLPSTKTKVNGIKKINGLTTYNINKDVNFQIKPTRNGFQSLININNLNAPKEFEFKVDLPKGSRLISAKDYLGKDGDTKEVFIVDSNNKITSIFSPAWAKDANNKDIPTYYKINGNKLIQVVEFNENSIFPIVADPNWWKVSKCAAAIVLAVGTAIVPVAKATKIKRYIKELGGVKEAAKVIIGATSMAEKGAAFKKAAKGLATEVLGIAEIQDQCFS